MAISEREKELLMQVRVLLNFKAEENPDEYVWKTTCDDFFDLNRMTILNVLEKYLSAK